MIEILLQIGVKIVNFLFEIKEITFFVFGFLFGILYKMLWDYRK